MSTPLCPQGSLVDACDDGRLNAADRASIERHIAICGSCATRFDQNEKIRDALRAVRPEATELEHLRARTALLRAASVGAIAETRRPGGFARVGFALIAAAVVVATLGLGWVWGHASARTALNASASVPPSATDASVIPSDGARFERTRGGGLDTVTLSSGTLAVSTGSVRKDRLIVRTKDAEVESKDGAFHVDADDGRIRDVVVERGTVEVRYAGFVAVIPSGGSWRGSDAVVAVNAPSPPPPSVEPSAAPNAARSSATPAAVAVMTPAPATIIPAKALVHAAPNSVPAVSPPATEEMSAAPPPPPPPPAAGGVFSGAMRTLERGDFDGAAVALGAFSAAHPDDPRSDDAEYVRAIALQRAGHDGEARAAARSYLAHRPNGAHRSEAARLAGS